MVPKEFVAEVYRRMSVVSQLQSGNRKLRTLEEFIEAEPPFHWAYQAVNYRHRLPSDRAAAILDIGCGPGHFLAACATWGYLNLTAMDYVADDAEQFLKWGVRKFCRVFSDIPAALESQRECYDVIHAAHLIEHIPKHELLENVDAMFYALRPGGVLILETPNMLSSTAMASLFVTLGHEYGFSQHNLASLLSICGFQGTAVDPVVMPGDRWKWRLGNGVRRVFLLPTRLRNRLFGWGGSLVAASIIASGVRAKVDPMPERLAHARR